MAMAPYNNAPETGTRNSRPAGRGSGAGALVGGALFVGVIAVCALVISYNGIFQFAEYGGHEASPLAHVFPATYTLLVLMAFWVSYMLREARPGQRLWVDVVLIPALVLVAAAAMLLSNFELVESVNQRVANVIVAVAPLAALLVAFLLWLTVRAHIRRRRRLSPRPRPAQDRTTVLPARAAAPTGDGFDEDDDEEDDALSSRLLRLGAADDTVIRPSPTFRPAPEQDDVPPVSRLRAEPEAPGDDAPEKGGPAEGPEVNAPTEESDATVPEATVPDEPVASVPTVPLPRRSGRGGNPIKRAVETVPVVPGAAPPAPVEVGTDDGPTVPDHLGDEGFQHEPPPGDPTTDEAEAPAPVTDPDETATVEDEEPFEPVTGPGEPREERFGSATDAPDESAVSAPVTDPVGAKAAEDVEDVEVPDERAEATSEPVVATDAPGEEVGSRERTAPAASVAASEPQAPVERFHADAEVDEPAEPAEPAAAAEPDAPAPHLDRTPDAQVDADVDDTPTEPLAPVEPSPGDLWEPPEEEPDTSALDDYVPPVWTPPDEDPEDTREGDGRAGDGPDHSGAATAPTAPVEPAPALDHDTGPEVRAAFRIGAPSAPSAPSAPEPPSPVPPAPPRPPVEPRAPRTPHAPRVSGSVPPGAARPTPEPEPAPPENTVPAHRPGTRPAAPADPVHRPDTRPEAAPAPDAEPRQGAEPSADPEPARRPDPRPDPRPDAEPERPVLRKRPLRKPVVKRPMVLKPPRPPMPDFTAEPPSRRVRSEPLRPEE